METIHPAAQTVGIILSTLLVSHVVVGELIRRDREEAQARAHARHVAPATEDDTDHTQNAR